MAARSTYRTPSFDWNCADALIELRGVVKVFKSPAGEATVLKGVDVDFLCGQSVAVVGRSGSGKSTLVNMITGIDHPSAGTIQVAGVVLNGMSESNMSIWRGKTLGIVFQFFQLLPMLTLVENVMLPMDLCDMYAPPAREERAMQLLKRVGLEDFAHQLPVAVSGGQQQSAAVARALANDPPILIADEPTGNLDSKTAGEVMALFEELTSHGKTVLMVTHDSGLARRAARRLVISDGELVNEALASALPDLPHEVLLRLTHAAEPRRLQPGEPLPWDGLRERVAVVADGALEMPSSGRSFAAGSRVDFNGLLPRLGPAPELRASRQGAGLLLLPRGEVPQESRAPDEPAAPLRRRRWPWPARKEGA